MDTLLFFMYMVAYIALFTWGIFLAKNNRWITASNVVLLVVAGLLYDNAIVAVGRYIGEGSILKNLNIARFWIHAFFTPLLVLFAWNILKRADIKWAQKPLAKYGAIFVFFCLVILELFTETLGLKVEAKWEYGVLSYDSIEKSTSPPIMVIIVTAILLLTSLIIWWKQKWIWFFIGTLMMTIGSAVPIPVKSGAIVNGFELVLIVSLMATKYFQDQLDM
jgi:hypothetical protein